MSVSAITLFNYIYIKVNMPTVNDFDPSDAVNHWMAQKNRRPRESQKRKEQEYFEGVFSEAHRHKKEASIVSF